mmetsp:Transcript_12801/g.24972  ORF Transcript_12801/g.24972 Transcript_12801/m.24972 type:complete len:244 (-) Transcript_12801:1358-2089(-)
MPATLMSALLSATLFHVFSPTFFGCPFFLSSCRPYLIFADKKRGQEHLFSISFVSLTFFVYLRETQSVSLHVGRIFFFFSFSETFLPKKLGLPPHAFSYRRFSLFQILGPVQKNLLLKTTCPQANQATQPHTTYTDTHHTHRCKNACPTSKEMESFIRSLSHTQTHTDRDTHTYAQKHRGVQGHERGLDTASKTNDKKCEKTKQRSWAEMRSTRRRKGTLSFFSTETCCQVRMEDDVRNSSEG